MVHLRHFLKIYQGRFCCFNCLLTWQQRIKQFNPFGHGNFQNWVTWCISLMYSRMVRPRHLGFVYIYFVRGWSQAQLLSWYKDKCFSLFLHIKPLVSRIFSSFFWIDHYYLFTFHYWMCCQDILLIFLCFLESCYDYATIIYYVDMLHASCIHVVLKLSNVNKRAVFRLMNKKNIDNAFSWVHEMKSCRISCCQSTTGKRFPFFSFLSFINDITNEKNLVHDLIV